MLNAITNYMLLPKEMSDFEDRYLGRMNRIAVGFFLTHLPVMTLIAFFNDTDPVLAATLTSLVLAGPLFAFRSLQCKRAVSVVMGIAAMFMGGLLVHFGQGPVQIEMHFYFFVLLALLAVFANPLVIVAAAVTAALHHTVLWLLLPESVFNYDAPFWVVAVHAAFVVLESIAACFIARSFFDNVIGLEKKVAERTFEIDKRNSDMRRILNSVKQGFFTIDCESRISKERSAAVETLLGPISESETFLDVLRRYDGNVADWYELGLEDVFADIMPLDVTLDQLPKRIVAGEKTISIVSGPIHENDKLTGLAIVLTDITAEVRREELEAASREMISVIEHAAKDKAGLVSFYEECSTLVESLGERETCDLVLTKRRVHTLKGNSAIFGLNRVSEACHRIEDYISEYQEFPEQDAWDAVVDSWKSASDNILKVVGKPTTHLEISSEEVTDVLEGLLNQTPRDELAVQLASWQLEPTRVALARVSDRVACMASQLGKDEIEVKIDDNDLRLDCSDWSEFWSSFIHLVRNAVDHGIESPDERLSYGKTETPTIEVSTRITGQQFHISISDNGRGINWDKIAQAAYERGLPAETEIDLIDAMFADGVSTADVVTETSGRGVGMAALKESCEKQGGVISVESEPRRGTRFTFKFPIKSMASSTLKKLTEQHVKDPERALKVS